MSAGLIVKGLSAGYGPIRVLQGVDLEAPAGEITVVVGPNGAGKTTLLKAVSGLIPREGEVVFEGETVVVGDTHDPTSPPLFGDAVRYELLCRRHFTCGELGA